MSRTRRQNSESVETLTFLKQSMNNQGDEHDPSIINEISSNSDNGGKSALKPNVIVETECSDRTQVRVLKQSLIKSILEESVAGTSIAAHVIDDFSNASNFKNSTAKK
jgi:hypothetical protein